MKMTNDELQKAIDSLLNHVGKQKRKWWGGMGNEDASGAISDCLGRLLYEQLRRAGAYDRLIT